MSKATTLLKKLSPQRVTSRIFGWRLLLAALIVATAGYWGWHRYAAGTGQPQHAAEISPPVHVAVVQKADFPVYLTGLGTVQASNTVTVRTRVDGQILKVGFEEGQMVHQGDLLMQIDPAPFQATLDQAKAKLAQDQASLKNAQQDLSRTTSLSKQGDATQQLLDQRTANVASLAALLQADQAAIESARVQLAYTTIHSPITGRAGFRLIDPGNIVHASDQGGFLTITQLQPIAVIFTAPEQELPAINDALRTGPLKVTAYSSDGKRALGEGTLRLVDNQVDVASGTIRLKAGFENTNTALWPGLSVTTRLLVSTIKDVVVVPDAAVQRGPNGLYAYVVTNDSKAELRDLKVGRIENHNALIEQGLSAGERIVTSGHYRVQPGGPVQVLAEPNQKTAVKPTAAKAD